MNTLDPIEDRIRASKLPQLRDLYGYSASVAESDAELAMRRYEYALEQRDKLNERIRFGCLTLNAASLVALGTLAQNIDKVVDFGLSKTTITGVAALFGMGLAFGALAIWSNGSHYVDLAAQAFKFRLDTAHRSALYQAKISERAEDEVSEELKKAPPSAPAFAYSTRTITLTNFSGCFWLVGLTWIIGTLAV